MQPCTFIITYLSMVSQQGYLLELPALEDRNEWASHDRRS